MTRSAPRDVLAAIVRWWAANPAPPPWFGADRWAVLLGEVMSHQTQLARAVERWRVFHARWPTPAAFAAAPLGEVLAAWHGLGYPRRARDLHRAAAQIAADGWPDDLTHLPGVGPYTAAAIRVLADGEASWPRDVNVRRVETRRFGGALPAAPDPAAVQAVLEFGQRVCTPRPACGSCPVADGCPVGAGGPDPAPRARRQAPYAGSMRARRGALLARLAAGERPLLADDAEAAASLVTDGIACAEGPFLVPAP